MIKKQAVFIFLFFGVVFGGQSRQVVAKWEIQKSPVSSSLRGLSVYSEQVIWASGSAGTWLRTIDGGVTWDHGKISGLDTVDFRSIHALGVNEAIAVSAGEPAVIYKTTDGGTSWQLKSQQAAPAFLDGIYFVDRLRGYVLGDPVDGRWMILETQDGGENWMALETAPAAVPGEGGFAASSSSLVAFGEYIFFGSGGSESNLWQSADRGKTWTKFVSPLTQGEASQGIFALCVLENSTLLALGGDYLKPDGRSGTASIFSLEKGVWSDLGDLLGGYRSGGTYSEQNDWVIAVGTNGSDISLDQGKNWTKLSEEGFHTVKTDSRGETIWAAGAKGKLARLSY